MLKGQQIPKPLPGEHGTVVGQPEGAFQPKLVYAFPAPSGHIILPALFRAEQRQPDQVIHCDGFFLCQGIIRRKNQAPHVRLGKAQEIIFGPVRFFRQYGKIQQSLIQLFRYLLRIPAGNMVVKLRVLLSEILNCPRQYPNLIGLRHPQINIAAGDIIQGDKFLGDLIRHADQILCPVAQQHAFLRQANAEAVPGEQLFAQFILQRFQRLRQGRLGHVQLFRGPGHIFFSCDRQKIAQGSDFHPDLHEMHERNIMIFIITISKAPCKQL